MATQRQYGLWGSPITAKSVAGGLHIRDAQWDSGGTTLVWLEGRSDRGVLVAAGLDGDAPRDLTSDLSVRARVGYGGGDFAVGGGTVFFSSNGQLFRQSLAGGAAKAITPAFADCAAPVLSPDNRWVLYVFSHTGQDGLAIVDADGAQWPQQVATGHDFFMQPCWHPHGHSVAWVAWDHPNMPWDGTTLYLADVATSDGAAPVFAAPRVVAGSAQIAIFQPAFSPDGRYLAYLGDEGGWHNIYLYDLEAGTTRQLTHETEAQLGEPAWAQGMRTYGWSHDSTRIVFVRNTQGVATLWSGDVQTGTTTPLPGLERYSVIEQPALNPTRPLLSAIVASGTQPTRLMALDVAQGVARIVKRTRTESVSPETLVAPQPIAWRSAGNVEVYGMLYLPTSDRWTSSGLPPAIITIHGGPTGQSMAGYDSEIQFFATRGYAVLDVNYRGSTGYGRAYMEALRGAWGVADVEDAISGAQHLVEQGLADGGKLVIMGGSAGGYTVLQALVTHPGFFKAAVCRYGVANAFTLAADTHKFEQRYLDSLLGPLPEASALYRERSPIFQVEQLRDAIAVFQGSDDTVVPPSQSEAIVASLRQRGVPHEYHLYQGEGHGWRKSETIEAYYNAVEAFLRQYVLFS